jgi:hypothetical protein
VSADPNKVEASGWARPLEALASQPAQIRDGLSAHLDFRFSRTAGADPVKQAAELIDTDRKGLIARLNGWRSFSPGRNVTWPEVVDRLINAFGVPAEVNKPIERREQRLQKLFWEKGLPRGSVVFSFGDAVDDAQGVKAVQRRFTLDPVRIVMQTMQGLASLYTADAAPAVNCVYAILEMLHPVEVEAPFRSLPNPRS